MKTTDFSPALTSTQLAENLQKQFGTRVNLNKYDREQLEDIRNKLRTRIFQQEGSAGVNDLLTNETYQKDKAMLELLNIRIKEMLGEDIKKLRDKMDQLSEAKKGDGNLANNAKPYDKITRGDVIAGRLGKDEKGGKKEKKVKEASVSNAFTAHKEPRQDTSTGKFDKTTRSTGDVYTRKTDQLAKGTEEPRRAATTMKSKKTGKALGEAGYNPNSAGATHAREVNASHKAELEKKAKAGDEGAKKLLAAMKDKEETRRNDRNDRMEREGIEKKHAKGCDCKECMSTMEGKKAKPDANKDGIPDYAQDGKGSKDLGKGKGGKPQKGVNPFAKKVKEGMFKSNVRLVNESLAYYLSEDEEGKAKAITAAGDMVNDFTSWMQRVGQYQTKAIIELSDEIRAEFGPAQAEAFKQAVGPALSSALEVLTSQREAISNAVASLATGEAPAPSMGMEPGMDAGMPPEPGMDATEPDAMNPEMGGDDEFGASDAAAGGPSTSGREMRESKFARKLQESHSIMSKLAS